MVYWYRLRIPFANWVMTSMFLAHFGLQDFTTANPPWSWSAMRIGRTTA